MACAEDRTKLLVKSVCKTVQKSLFLLPPPQHVYQDLSMCHDRPVLNTTVH